MAAFEIQRMPVTDAGLRAELKEAASSSGRNYELALGGAITKRKLPILEMIEGFTGIPIVGVSMEKTRGPRSSQSQAWFQWQRGHKKAGEDRRPDATIEFVGHGGKATRVYALELTLQSDVTRIGDSRRCAMSMGKASQLALTAALLAAKPTYQDAAIEYWCFCPWEPTQETRDKLLIPFQNMGGTERVSLTWTVVDCDA